MHFFKVFGQFVRCTREANDLGLRECARRVGMSPSYLSRIELGEVGPPSEEKLIKLSKVLGLDLDSLIFASERIPSDVVVIVESHGVIAAELLRLFDGMTSEGRVEFLKVGKILHRRGGGYDASE